MGNGQSSSGSNSRNSSDQQIKKALELQRQIHVRQVQDLLESHITQQRTEVPTIPQRNTTRKEIEEAITSLDRPRTLYPNLYASGNSTLSSINNNYQQNPTPSHSTDFVFVNNNVKVTPSAPPAPSSPTPRTARSQNRGSGNGQVLCPTCKSQFGTKIFNCLSGHASCLDCRIKKKPCGLCGSTITEIRNISMEEVVVQFKVPCYNKTEGCCLSFSPADMEDHLKECPFGEVQCPLPKELCVWTGKLSFLSDHFKNFHPAHIGEIDTEMFMQVTNKRMQLIKIGNFNFIFNLHVSSERKCIYFTVQLIGTKHSAAKWNYEIHIYDKSAPRRKYQYVDKCFSYSQPLPDLEKENKCAVIPLQYVQTFVNNGLIACKFYVNKEDGNKVERRDASNSRQATTRDLSNNRRGRTRNRGGFRKN